MQMKKRLLQKRRIGYSRSTGRFTATFLACRVVSASSALSRQANRRTPKRQSLYNSICVSMNTIVPSGGL